MTDQKTLMAISAICGGLFALAVAYVGFGFRPSPQPIIQVVALPAPNQTAPTPKPAPTAENPPPSPAAHQETLNDYMASRTPATFTKTVSFMPGQYVDLPNRKFRKIEIRATFPLRVLSGDCHMNYGVQFFCNGDPADIFITDMRQLPILGSPQGNSVTITATE